MKKTTILAKRNRGTQPTFVIHIYWSQGSPNFFWGYEGQKEVLEIETDFCISCNLLAIDLLMSELECDLVTIVE